MQFARFVVDACSGERRISRSPAHCRASTFLRSGCVHLAAVRVEGALPQPCVHIRPAIADDTAAANERREITKAGGAGLFQSATLDAQPLGDLVGRQKLVRGVGVVIGQLLLCGFQGLPSGKIRPPSAA